MTKYLKICIEHILQTFQVSKTSTKGPQKNRIISVVQSKFLELITPWGRQQALSLIEDSLYLHGSRQHSGGILWGSLLSDLGFDSDV